LHENLSTGTVVEMIRVRNRVWIIPMKEQSKKTEIPGTRAGYIIRFTCPSCAFENIIVSRSPRDHFKERRDANCSKCRQRSSVLTPYATPKKSPQSLSPKGIGTLTR
jgi:hypothetical protein